MRNLVSHFDNGAEAEQGTARENRRDEQECGQRTEATRATKGHLFRLRYL